MEDAFEAPDTIRRMPITTWGLLYSLKPEQRRQCEFAMTDPGRLDWDFIPKPDRQGIPLAQLDSHQRTLAQSMLAAGLSVRGYSQALQIMAMEHAPGDRGRPDRGRRRPTTGHHLATRLRSSVPDD